ncbi:MAG: FAD-dependent monooxygenase, partial [Lysobacteraceae bacterium]
MQSRELDVLVVGGGLVGGSLALALARCGVGVALVDIPSPAPGMASDPRKLALSAASLSALGALGVLARLPGPPTPIRRIHASRAGDFGRVVLEAAELGR